LLFSPFHKHYFNDDLACTEMSDLVICCCSALDMQAILPMDEGEASPGTWLSCQYPLPYRCIFFTCLQNKIPSSQYFTAVTCCCHIRRVFFPPHTNIESVLTTTGIRIL
jgi:hypothetical protein